MKQRLSFSGFISVQLVSGDIPRLLERVTKNGITLFRIHRKDPLTVLVWLKRKDYQKFKEVAEKTGAETQVLERSGTYWMLMSLLHRPIAIAGIAGLLLLSWWVPTKVLFVRVEGNTSVPTKLILEKASECGIAFGAHRRDVRSEKMKNSLLAALPQLQWTGINTYGCTALISVNERTKPDDSATKHRVSSIVAERDGIIYSCTAANGTLLCKEGQAVRAGEVLVSGYTDCGIKINATQAMGEIYAQTMRQMSVKTPLDYTQKGEVYQVVNEYSLILGKKRIKLSKDSGIYTSTCDKMYSQYYCVLPGGFQLPIALSVEQTILRKTNVVSTASELTETFLQEFAQDYLLSQMLSGRIFGKLEQMNADDEVSTLTGRYICIEMIGREQNEEIYKHDG